MLHRPWPYTQRLVDRMADSTLLDGLDMGTLRRPARSAGVHASELLRKMHPHPNEAKNALLSPELQAEAAAQLRLYGLLGLAFEDRAELALLQLAKEDDWPWHVMRPGEVMLEDVGPKPIACSPDILLVPKPGSGETQVRELSIKTTWKSCRGLPLEDSENEFPKSFDYYVSQCMTYALPLDTVSSILFCYFMCGDWKPPVPKVLAWELDFSDQELAENRDALATIARG